MTRRGTTARTALAFVAVSVIAAVAAAAAFVGFLALTSAPAYAQEVNLATLDEAPANRAYVRTGAEFGFVAGVGYARALSLGERRLLAYGEVTVPWTGVDTSDYQLRAGALVPIVGWGNWRLAGSLAPTVRATTNDVGRLVGLGFDGGLTGGYYARHVFGAAEFGFDYVLSTHVTNSQLYRDTAYADARDGWYVNPGGNYRLGGQVGASFGRYDVVLRGGILREMMGARPLFPFYGTLAMAASW